MPRKERQRRSYTLEHNPDFVMYNVHPAVQCEGQACPIHNKTDHHMRSWPQHWRHDRAMIERICPHGWGHPDPDQFDFWGLTGESAGVHGCDGCCVPPAE